jgi:hypothetical protein
MRISKTSQVTEMADRTKTINILGLEPFVRLELSDALKTLKTLETNACE